jgi:hypothetical protein
MDTIKRSIKIISTYSNIISTSDTVICIGDSVRINSAGGEAFCWSPTDFLSSGLDANPVAKPMADIVYYLRRSSFGPNMAVNGNFSQGTTGFSSAYQFNFNGNGAGRYFVGPSATAWFSLFAACNSDHTTGSGNMMLVNGADVANVVVWEQTISVTPNKDYIFSAWFQNISTVSPARLRFSINDNPAGAEVITSNISCKWEKSSLVWNSGSNTTAKISLLNLNTDFSGNDFALEDIEFREVDYQYDSIKVSIDADRVKAGADTAVCVGSNILLRAQGAKFYRWSPANAVSDPAISNPGATVINRTDFVVTGTTNKGCLSKDTLTVDVVQSLQLQVSADTLICEGNMAMLYAAGGQQYLWQPSSGLSDSTSARPVARPQETTTYTVVAYNALGCAGVDSVQVAVKPKPRFSVSPASLSICAGDTATLVASGGNFFTWTPTSALSPNSGPTVKASPQSTTVYQVKMVDELCKDSTVLSATVIVNPLPIRAVASSNGIDCNKLDAQLIATGGVTYQWAPDVGLSNTGISNPVAFPNATTTYRVLATDVNGCRSDAMVTAQVSLNSQVNKSKSLRCPRIVDFRPFEFSPK